MISDSQKQGARKMDRACTSPSQCFSGFLDIPKEKDLQTKLLSFVAPQALLDRPLQTTDFPLMNKRVRLLNYTDANLKFVDHRLYLDKKFLTTFTTEDCHMVAYHVQGHPDVICIDVKDDPIQEPIPRQFVFDNELYSANESPDVLRTCAKLFAVKPLSLAMEDIKNDDTWLAIAKMMPSEALVNDRREILRFNTRGNSDASGENISLTLINDTSMDLSFDVARHLRINGKIFSTYTADDCFSHAYTLQGHPNLICVDEKDVGKDSPHSYYIHESWAKKKSALLMTKKCKTKKYQWHTLIHKQFLIDKVTDHTFPIEDPSLKMLLSKLSPFAIMPSCAPAIKINETRDVMVLNLTSHNIEIDDLGTLLMDGQFVFIIPKEFKRGIFYRVAPFPEVLCLESCNIENEMMRRRFIDPFKYLEVGLNSTIATMPALATPKRTSTKSLKEISKDLTDVLLPTKAIIRRHPRISFFDIPKMKEPWLPRSDIRCGLINHTKHSITIDLLHNVSIDGCMIGSLDTSQANIVKKNSLTFIAYQVAKKEHVIHIGGHKFYRALNWAPKFEVRNTLLDIALQTLFNTIWAGTKDAASSIYKGDFTTDVTSQIMLIYLRLKNMQLPGDP
jgi:hypothetical protein